MIVGKAIKRVRLARGYTQKEVAKRIGVLSNSYSRLEGGFHSLNSNTMHKLCKALEIDEEVLILITLAYDTSEPTLSFGLTIKQSLEYHLKNNYNLEL